MSVANYNFAVYGCVLGIYVIISVGFYYMFSNLTGDEHYEHYYQGGFIIRNIIGGGGHGTRILVPWGEPLSERVR